MVVVALLGMIPAARATGIGSDVQRPLATVLVGGLLSTLVLTLVALPSLYALVVGRRRLQKSTADTVSEATDVASHMHTHINH